MSDQEFIISAPHTVKVGFAILPVDGPMNSLNILMQGDELSGLGEWVGRTLVALSPDRRMFHEVLFTVFLKGIDYDGEFDEFSAYLDKVATLDPFEMRDHIVEMLTSKCSGLDLDEEITAERLLEDRALFVHAFEEMHKPYTKKGHEFDSKIYAEAHDILQDPRSAHARVVEHLNYMWDKHLRDEWNRNLPVLEECANAFNQLNFDNMTVLEATKVVTGRDMSEYWTDIDPVERLMFVPSVHIGPYNAFFVRDNVMYVFFGARMPEGVSEKSAALSRSELLVRLSALADDTRLQILELLVEQNELCAQDIMTTLNLSQSSASRHLRQLTATGYIVERRREVAKCYSLNMARVEDTLAALKHFLKA